MEISFIWFDIGYTLLYMQRESTYQQALRQFGIEVSVEQLEKQFHLTDKLFMREYPGIFLKPRAVYMPWFLGILNYHLGLSLDVCDVDARWEKIQRRTDPYWLPFCGAHAVLDRLQQEGFGLGIISNWDHSARQILDNAGLLNYFEHFIISGEVGFAKPAAEIFQIALKTAGIDAADCLYVGDNYYDDARGARAAGMHALIINRFGCLGVEEIKDCAIIHDISEVPTYVKYKKPPAPFFVRQLK